MTNLFKRAVWNYLRAFYPAGPAVRRGMADAETLAQLVAALETRGVPLNIILNCLGRAQALTEMNAFVVELGQPGIPEKPFLATGD